MEIKIILEPQEEGGYTVYAPSIQGCISQGETKAEAIKNIKEAIELCLEVDQYTPEVNKKKIETIKISI